MTKTRYRLHELGEGLDWVSLGVFVSGLSYDSALYRSMHPDSYPWDNGNSVAWLLAEVLDELRYFRYEHAASKMKSKPRAPQRIPRPGEKREMNVIGSDPIPISEFDEWWETH